MNGPARRRPTARRPGRREASRAGAEANREQAKRPERVFGAMNLTAEGTPDPAMRGIIDVDRAVIDETGDPTARVAAHFHLAAYGTPRAHARAPGNDEAAELPKRTPGETRRIDEHFTEPAQNIINRAGCTGPARPTAGTMAGV